MPSIDFSLAIGACSLLESRALLSPRWTRLSNLAHNTLCFSAQAKGLSRAGVWGIAPDSGGKASEDLKRRVLCHEPVSTVRTTPLNFVLSGPSKNGPIQDQQNGSKTLKTGDAQVSRSSATHTGIQTDKSDRGSRRERKKVWTKSRTKSRSPGSRSLA